MTNKQSDITSKYDEQNNHCTLSLSLKLDAFGCN